MIQKEINKVKFSGHWDKSKATKKFKVVPLVITFHLLLDDVGNILQFYYTLTKTLKEFLHLDPL